MLLGSPTQSYSSHFCLSQEFADVILTVICLCVQPAAGTGAETTAAAVSPVNKADIQPQAQTTAQQQTTPPSVVSSTSQQGAQTPSSPAPPQRPARRKQASQVQQTTVQPSPSKPASSQPPVSQPSAAQAQPASTEIGQKSDEAVSGLLLINQYLNTSFYFFILMLCVLLLTSFDQTQPASPKTTEEGGHQRIPSDTSVSSVSAVPVSDSQQSQGAGGDNVLNQ